jgi:PIN domain nuclease of toxin-antitoxin system
LAISGRYLIDTNVFIWANIQVGKLTPIARQVLTDPNGKRYVSIGSIWEMQIKHALGKLNLPANADEIASRFAEGIKAEILDIRLSHLGRIYDLPSVHRDPFDRLIAAQASFEGLTLISPDPAFRAYPISVQW